MESGAQVDSPTIKAINKGVVHRICSGQVILDLSSAVKELVENSLDAGATSIEVSLKDYGEKWFKVIDNGCGISPKNFKVLALKHHTSKITDFPDLQSLTTFGFRGEALSSLCALGNLTVETRTKNEPVATHLTFDHSGLLTSERKTARQVGTTVCIEKLFSCLPVRSKEFSRNIRKEYGKLISLLNAYALIAKGVRFVCTNTTGKNGKSVVLQTQGSNSIKDNIITVFGMNTFTCLEPLSMHVSESCLVEGFLSKPGHGSGRNLGDRQFFFVNGRPVDMPKVTKVVNELYKSANSRQYPIAILDFTISTKTYDVNVTPDKRKIFFSDEGSLMLSLKEAIEKIYSPNQCSYIANKLEEPKKKKSGSELSPCHEERQVSLKQSPSEGCSNMEVEYVEERNLEEKHKDNGDPPIEIKKHFSRTCADESTDNIDKMPIQRDFSLKLHTAGKVDSSFSYHSKQSRTPIPNSAKDKYIGPLSRRVVKDDHENVQSSRVSSIVQSSLTKFVTVSKRKHDNSCTVLSEVPVLRNETTRHQVRKISLEMCAGTSRSILDHNQMDDSSDINHDELSASSREVHFSNEVENSLLAETNVQNGDSEEEDLEQNKSVPYIGDASDDLTGKNLESVPQVLSDTRKGTSDAQEDLEHKESVPHIDDCTDALTGKNLETMPQVLSCVDPNKETLDAQEDLEHKKLVPCIDDSTDALTNKNLESIPQVLSSADPNALSSDVPRLFSGPVTCSVLQFSMKDLKMSRQKRLSILKSGFTREKMKIKRCYTAATLEFSQPENEERKAKTLAAATTELERLFNKEDFDRMKVIGQFNLGFIIGRIDRDLFIIDQHAADEKYNFERLSESTILNQQPLLKSMRLELSPEEEITASMHMDIIRKNGFSLVEDMHAPPGHHFRLSAVPFSKNITFGAEDVKELISTLSDSQGDCMMLSCYKMDTKDSICPSRVRGMLASRACRSSVMIGDALGKNQMEKILKNLAQLKSPWNCPHGRPTMRHLIDLTTILKNEQEEDLNID